MESTDELEANGCAIAFFVVSMLFLAVVWAIDYAGLAP